MPPFADVSSATVDGVELAYRRRGSGDAVVLVHGIPTSSRLWDEVGAALADSHDVVAVDMLGYGESAKPLDRDVSVSAQADLLPALLDSLGIEHAAVVGHDTGGAVAQIFAVRHPDRLRALGLIDSVCFDSWPIPAMAALKRFAPLASKLPPDWVTKTLEQATKRGLPEGPAHDAMAASLAAWDKDADSLRAFFRNVEALDARHTQQIAPQLGDIRVPTHVVWGAADPFQKPEWAPRLRDAIPGATLRMLDAGHFVPWERPADVAAEIEQLLERAQS